MSTFRELKDGINKAWGSITHGWNELVDRAGEALTRFNPTRSTDQMETHHEQIALQGSRWAVLPAEVCMDDHGVEVSIEVPGMNPDDFDIHVVEDLLVIRGEKRVERERKQGHYHIMERAYGRFERAVRLPVDVDEAGTKARYNHGVLHIVMPRIAAQRPRRIEVQAA